MSVDDRSAKQPEGEGLPEVGDQLAGRYRIDELLGTGGMGAVFSAHDSERDEQVAVKVMLPEEARNQGAAKRFTREARAARAIVSEHVAQVLDVGELGRGIPFIVLELLEGKRFDEVIDERAPMPVEEAIDCILQACEGIAEAHALGIIHRDLKPSNLHLSEGPNGAPLVKVFDFGIAKATRRLDAETEGVSLTDSSSTLGSPQYMSPEQLRSSKSVDVGTDIWSLGLILHKMLTGSPAFEADSMGAHFTKIVAEPPTRLRACLPEAPADLEAVILCCLQKAPEARYRDIGQLAEALAELAPPDARARVARIREVLDEAGASSPGIPDPEACVSRPGAASASDGLIIVPWQREDGTSATKAWDTSSDRDAPASSPPKRRPWLGVALLVAAAGGGAGIYRLAQPDPGEVDTRAPASLHSSLGAATSSEPTAPRATVDGSAPRAAASASSASDKPDVSAASGEPRVPEPTSTTPHDPGDEPPPVASATPSAAASATASAPAPAPPSATPSSPIKKKGPMIDSL